MTPVHLINKHSIIVDIACFPCTQKTDFKLENYMFHQISEFEVQS